MVIEVQWKRIRGSPKRKWLDNTRNHLSAIELSGDETQCRINWKRLKRNIDPHILMKLGYLTEIRGDSIISGHRWSEKRKLSTWMGTSKKKLPMRFDDGLCECRHSGRKPRGPPSSGIV